MSDWYLRFDWDDDDETRADVEHVADEALAVIRARRVFEAWPKSLRALYVVKPDRTIGRMTTRVEVEFEMERRAAVKAALVSARRDAS